MYRALSIAGFDPSGGAGVLMDIKIFTRLEVYGYGVVSAITVQSPRDVYEVHCLEPSVFRKCLDTALCHLLPNAVKIGMLGSSEIVTETSKSLKRFGVRNIVVDPVFRAKNGVPLLTDDGVQIMIYRLFPLATVITPNISEASRILGYPVQTVEDAKSAAREFYRRFNVAVVVKGGHLVGEPVDIFFDGSELLELKGKRISGAPHGTGCVFSSAIAAILAKGVALSEAVSGAKRLTQEFIRMAKGEPLIPL